MLSPSENPRFYPQDPLAQELRRNLANSPACYAVDQMRQMSNPALLTHTDTDGFISSMALERGLGLRIEHIYPIETGDKCPTVPQFESLFTIRDQIDGLICLDLAPTNPEKYERLSALGVPMVNLDHHRPVVPMSTLLRINPDDLIHENDRSPYTTIKIVADTLGVAEEDLWLLQLGLFGDEKERYWQDTVLQGIHPEQQLRLQEIARMLNISGTAYRYHEGKTSVLINERKRRLYERIRNARSPEELRECILEDEEAVQLYQAVTSEIQTNLARFSHEVEENPGDSFVFFIESPEQIDIIESFLKSTGEFLARFPECFFLLVQKQREKVELRGYCLHPKVNCGKIFTQPMLDGGGRPDAGGGRCMLRVLDPWVSWIQQEAQRMKNA